MSASTGKTARVGLVLVSLVVVATALVVPTGSVKAVPEGMPPTWPAGAEITVVGVTDASATLSFPAAIDDVEVAEYRFYDDETGALLDTGPNTTHVLDGLGPNTAYSVRIEAVDADGNESRPLAELTFAAREDLDARYNPHSMDVADLNGDGSNDLVTATAGSHAASVLLGTGDGNLGPIERWSVGEGGFPKNTDIADLNDDGYLDVVSSNQNTSSVGVLLGNGDGTFGAPTEYQACNGTHDVVIEDFNEDAVPDVVAVCFGSRYLTRWLGDGDGTFSRLSLNDYEASGSPHAVVAADFDDDGFADVAVANNAGGVEILTGNGDGSFDAAVFYASTGATHDIASGDFNGDGDEDIVTADQSSDNVSVRLGGAGATFGDVAVYPVDVQPKGVSVGDLDGDGHLDIAVANARNNYPSCPVGAGDPITVLFGDGTGEFPRSRDYPVGVAPFDAAIADLNGDGHNELIAPSWCSYGGVADGGGEVSIYYNLGFGGPTTSFTTAPVATTTTTTTTTTTSTTTTLPPPPPPPPPSPVADTVVLVEGNGRWHLRFDDGSSQTFFYGNPEDVPLFGDWDGDGLDTPGMFRPSNGFVYLTNTLPPTGGVGVGESALTFFFGLAGDQVVVGDWNGDGRDTLGVRRGGKMYLTNTNATSIAEYEYFFGVAGDHAFGGDPDGDGLDNIYLYRPATGFVYFTTTNPLSVTVAPTADSLFFGVPSDQFVVGDWDGDEVDTIGIFRNGSFYLANSLGDPTVPGDPVMADWSIAFGRSEWRPVAGAWQ